MRYEEQDDKNERHPDDRVYRRDARQLVAYIPDAGCEVSEAEGGDEGHAVGEVEPDDGEVEDRIDCDSIDKHEEALGQRAHCDETNGASGRLVG